VRALLLFTSPDHPITRSSDGPIPLVASHSKRSQQLSPAALDLLQPLLPTGHSYHERISQIAFWEVGQMLWTLFVILLVLWLVGVVSSYTLGGFIHLLLVLALVALVFQLLTGRRTAL